MARDTGPPAAHLSRSRQSEGCTLSGISGSAGTGDQTFVHDKLHRVKSATLAGVTQVYADDANGDRIGVTRVVLADLDRHPEIGSLAASDLLDISFVRASQVLGALVKRGTIRRATEQRRGPGVRYVRA